MTTENLQCAKCGIPKYRHPYFEDCGHDFLNLNWLKGRFNFEDLTPEQQQEVKEQVRAKFDDVICVVDGKERKGMSCVGMSLDKYKGEMDNEQ